MSGLPPFLLFFYKYYLLLWLFAANHYFIVVYLLVLNVLSLVYYLKIIKSVLFGSLIPSRKLVFISAASFNFFNEIYRKTANFLRVFLFFFGVLTVVFLLKFDVIFCEFQGQLISVLHSFS